MFRPEIRLFLAGLIFIIGQTGQSDSIGRTTILRDGGRFSESGTLVKHFDLTATYEVPSPDNVPSASEKYPVIQAKTVAATQAFEVIVDGDLYPYEREGFLISFDGKNDSLEQLGHAIYSAQEDPNGVKLDCPAESTYGICQKYHKYAVERQVSPNGVITYHLRSQGRLPTVPVNTGKISHVFTGRRVLSSSLDLFYEDSFCEIFKKDPALEALVGGQTKVEMTAQQIQEMPEHWAPGEKLVRNKFSIRFNYSCADGKKKIALRELRLADSGYLKIDFGIKRTNSQIYESSKMDIRSHIIRARQ